MAKVLVVDDEQDVVELLKFVLIKAGHAVVEAFDGVSGLELASTENPDLIVLDVMMPEMDGYTMNTRLLQNARTRDIPVIVLTARGQMRDMFEVAGNVRSYIEKPFEPKELLSCITAVLQKPTANPWKFHMLVQHCDVMKAWPTIGRYDLYPHD